MGPSPGVVLFLLLLQGAPSRPSQPAPACSVPCLCRQGSRLNCSRAGLSSSTPLELPATVASLDLSRNDLTAMPPRGRDPVPLRALTSLLLAHNRIASLSLCARPAPPGSPRPCGSWAPRLRLLSLERNRLRAVPEGLGGGVFLRVLHLSHNHIDALRHRDLQGCKQLKELYLQHNAISSVHPLAFQDLHALRVLNLSFNALSTTATAAYLSVRNFDARVNVRGNRWRCDCDLRTVKRWMAFDRDRGRLPWQLLCEEPPHLAGRDLLHLDEAELTCAVTHRSATFYQEVSTASGADVLLPCHVQEQGNGSRDTRTKCISPPYEGNALMDPS